MYNERRPHTGDILSGGCTCIMKGGDILSGGVYMYNERRPHTGDILSGGCTCIMKGDPTLGISYQGGVHV